MNGLKFWSYLISTIRRATAKGNRSRYIAGPQIARAWTGPKRDSTLSALGGTGAAHAELVI